MKISTEKILLPLNKEALKELTLEIKETIAIPTPVTTKTKKIFTSADLWKIRRFSRTSCMNPILVY